MALNCDLKSDCFIINRARSLFFNLYFNFEVIGLEDGQEVEAVNCDQLYHGLYLIFYLAKHQA